MNVTLQCLGLSPIELIHREVDFMDIAYDEISAKHYKEEEVRSQKLTISDCTHHISL